MWAPPGAPPRQAHAPCWFTAALGVTPSSRVETLTLLLCPGESRLWSPDGMWRQGCPGPPGMAFLPPVSPSFPERTRGVKPGGHRPSAAPWGTRLGASALGRLPGASGQLCSVPQQAEPSKLWIRTDTRKTQASERRPGGSGRQGRVGADGWAAGTPGAWLSHDSGVPAFLEHRGPPGHSAYGPRPHPLPVCPGTNKGCPDRLPEQQADPQPRPIVCPGKAASVSTWALPARLPALTA